MAEHGRFVWNELMTRDVEAAKRFYGATLGWSFAGMPMDDGSTYWIASQNGEQVAGLMAMQGAAFEGMPPHWFAYVEVDDVDAQVEHARTQGGKLVRPIFEVADVGRIAIVQDPTGAVLGWMTSVDGEADDEDDDEDDDIDDDE